jgi:hypothetical protein
MPDIEENLKPILFLDRAIDGPTLSETLVNAGANLKRHSLEYPNADNLADEVWLKEVGEKGWFVITRDRSIQTRHLEIAASIAAGVGMFVFLGGNVKRDEMAEILVSILPEIEKLALETERPFLFRIQKSGKIVPSEIHP